MVRETETMAAIAERNRGDCEAYSRALIERFGSPQGVQRTMARFQALTARHTPQQRAAFRREHGARLDAAARKLLPVARRCSAALARPRLQRIEVQTPARR